MSYYDHHVMMTLRLGRWADPDKPDRPDVRPVPVRPVPVRLVPVRWRVRPQRAKSPRRLPWPFRKPASPA